jgi:hypothetical protein
MKLRFPVDALWAQVRRMGASEREYSLEVSDKEPPPPIVTSAHGIDVTIEEVDTEFGLLSCNGAQVVLYIPDHGNNIDAVLANGRDGRRVHVADCATLEQMRQKNRFQRYRAVVNISGEFEVFGFSQAQGESAKDLARLQICINCLKHLNYNGYLTDPRRQFEIRKNFSLKDFFAEHSSLFRFLPTSFIERKEGYADNWREISERTRANKGYCCESCELDLNAYKYLLHTHHMDGNKRNNQPSNLKALCADCHRKQPLHDFMSVRARDMSRLQKLRKEQGILSAATEWGALLELVDPPYDGLLRFYQRDGALKPEVGYEVLNSAGVMVAEAQIAWPSARFAIVRDENERGKLVGLGWKVDTLATALRHYRQ